MGCSVTAGERPGIWGGGGNGSKNKSFTIPWAKALNGGRQTRGWITHYRGTSIVSTTPTNSKPTNGWPSLGREDSRVAGSASLLVLQKYTQPALFSYDLTSVTQSQSCFTLIACKPDLQNPRLEAAAPTRPFWGGGGDASPHLLVYYGAPIILNQSFSVGTSSRCARSRIFHSKYEESLGVIGEVGEDKHGNQLDWLPLANKVDWAASLSTPQWRPVPSLFGLAYDLTTHSREQAFEVLCG